MEALQQLASGIIPSAFPFAYSSEFDPGSPWSLCLALFPESRSLSGLEPLLTNSDSSRNEQLDPEIARFVQSRCISLGWIRSSSESDCAPDLFLKVRLRQTDSYCRQMDLPNNLRIAENDWADGTVRVLQLWRRLTNDPGNTAESDNVAQNMTLTQFESEDPERIFSQLVAVKPPKWDLRQRFDFLLMPYLRYTKRVDLAQQIVKSSELNELTCIVNIRELTSSVLERCLTATTNDWLTVQQIIEKVFVPSSNGVPSTPEVTTLKVEDLKTPTALSVELWNNLVATAQLKKFPKVTFHQLTEWATAPESLQEDLLVRFLQSNTHFTLHDLTVLRKTLLARIPEASVMRQCMRACLRNSRFMFIKKNLWHTANDSILVDEIKQSAREFEKHPTAVDLLRQITALELVENSDDSEIIIFKEKITRLNNVYKTFGLEPEFVLSHEPLENVTKVLESDSQAYLRYTDLVNLAGGGEEISSKVAEQCIEAALADDNLGVALEFFDRGFLIPKKSDTAWMAYYQAGKYISPNWDLPRPAKYLEKQIKLLSEALTLCEGTDLVSVLKAWSVIDEEKQEKARSVAPTPLLTSSHRSSISPSASSASTQESPRTVAVPHFDADKARDQISSIFKSGIGWVVGANPPP